MKNRKIFVFCVFFLYLLTDISFSENTTKLPVKKIFLLNSVLKKVGIRRGLLTYPHYQNIAMDSERNLYLLDVKNGRIIKISPKGEVLKIIGHFGTDELGLYYPQAIYIYNSVLYVITSSIRKKVLKGFDSEGKRLLKIIPFAPKNAVARSFLVDDKLFYVNLQFTNKSGKPQNLISVFDTKGKRLKSFGKPLKAQSWEGNIFFNIGLISKYGDFVIGALFYHPIIFHYTTGGKLIYYKNLLKGNFPEIKATYEFAKRNCIDTPEKRCSTVNGQISNVNFCYAAGIDRDLNLYYSTWELKENLKAPVTPVVYKFDKKGNHKETFVFTLNGKPVRVCYFIFDKKTGRRYGIGFIGSIVEKNIPIFLFKF